MLGENCKKLRRFVFLSVFNTPATYDANGNTIPSFTITLPEGNWNAVELANYLTNEINTTAGVPNLMSMVYNKNEFCF